MFRTTSRLDRSARRRRHARRRRGTENVQLLLALPVLVIVLFAAFQFAVLVIVQGGVSHAATVGAREAGKFRNNTQYVTPTTVGQVVNTVLSVYGIALGPNASVIVERSDLPGGSQQIGTFPCGPIAGPPITSNQVRVTVCVDLTTSPLLNCLTMYGLDFSGRWFQISSVSKLE